MRARLVIFNGPFVRGHWEATAWFPLKLCMWVCVCVRVWECMCTRCYFLTYHSFYHCAVCVRVSVCEAVSSNPSLPETLWANCRLLPKGQNLWPLRSRADQCPGVLLSRSLACKHPNRQTTGQLPTQTCAWTSWTWAITFFFFFFPPIIMEMCCLNCEC